METWGGVCEEIGDAECRSGKTDVKWTLPTILMHFTFYFMCNMYSFVRVTCRYRDMTFKGETVFTSRRTQLISENVSHCLSVAHLVYNSLSAFLSSQNGRGHSAVSSEESWGRVDGVNKPEER